MKKHLGAVMMVMLPSVCLADIQPLSGLWRHDVLLISAEGCPERMLPPKQQSYEVQLDMPRPFHPAGRKDPSQTWTRQSANLWSGLEVESEKSATAEVTMVTEYAVTVKSDRHIVQETVSTFTVPASMSADLGMTGTSCVQKSVTEQRYVGG